jgi:ubiquinone/menaquinone biosynthesis C-methylase UbiE
MVGDEHALSFGRYASSYAESRPEWPAPTAAWLVGDDVDPVPKRVLDLGAGTGKLSETLVSLGHSVLAIDPSADMLAELARRLPEVETRAGSAEQIPVGGGEFDCVAVAQAWHWFEPTKAATECARVLKPGGLLGIAWHRRDESVQWIARLNEIVGRMESVAKYPRAFGVDLPAPFGPVEQKVFSYDLSTTPSGLRALADTWSYVRLAPDRQAKLEAVADLARSAAEPDGRLFVPHETRCFRSRRELS